MSDKYFVPIASKTLDVLEAFENGEELTLEQVIKGTGIAHTTAFRILHTLTVRRYLTRSADGKRYRASRLRRRHRLGFASLASDTPFAMAITDGLRRAAAAAGVDLVVYDNQRDAETAVRNAHALVADHVEVAIEFQRHDSVAPVIADIFQAAGIPSITVLISQPGAIYFGVDNYRAGWTAGLALAQHAIDRWHGAIDLLVLLNLPQAGPSVDARFVGLHNGIAHRLGPLPHATVVSVDGSGLRAESDRAMRKILRRHPRARHIAIYAVNDESALGARDALLAAGRSPQGAILGNGGSTEFWDILRAPGVPYLGTIAFFPERYGTDLVQLALRVLRGEHVPPSHYIPHQLVDSANVDTLFPAQALA